MTWCPSPHRARRPRALFLLFFLLSLLAASDATEAQTPTPPWRGFADLASVGVNTPQPAGSAYSSPRALSADGRFFVFESPAWNIVADDTNGTTDLFVRDRLLGTTERVSVSGGADEGNDHSWAGSISTDGRFVVFVSFASNLVAGDTNGRVDVFVRDRQAGTTVRLNVAPDGTQSTTDHHHPTISSSGRFVTWVTGWPMMAYLVDRDVDGDGQFDEPGDTAVDMVSVNSSGVAADGDSDDVRVSDDGRYVAFDSLAANLTTDYTSNARNLYVRDRQTQETTLITRTIDGWPTTYGITLSSFDMSGDGRYLTYVSSAPDMVPGDTNNQPDLFLFDRVLNQTSRLSVTASGDQANGWSGTTVISHDGRYVIFTTAATNLASGPPPPANGWILCALDRQSGLMWRVDMTAADVAFNQPADGPAISADGSTIALGSTATNVVDGVTGSFYSSRYVLVSFAVSTSPAAPATYAAQGGTGSIQVETTLQTRWDAATTASWITLDGAAQTAAGARDIVVTVAPNSGPARSATVRVGQRTVTIAQAGIPTPPVITPSIVGPLGTNGWYVGNVTVTWSVVDAEAPITSTVGCAPTTIAADTSGLLLTCEATSDEGSASASVEIKRDTVPPAIDITSPVATPYSAGTPVTAAFTCADATSSVSTCTGTTAAGADVDTTTPGFHTVTVTATDRAGLTATRAVEYGVATGACSWIVPNPHAGWWRFEGSIRDFGSNAVRVGLTEDVYVPGVVGQAYAYGATDGYLQTEAAISITTNRLFAVAAWVKPSADGLMAVTSKADQYRVVRLANGNLGWGFKVPQSPVQLIDTGAFLPLNTWTHVVVARDGATVRSYVNGRLVHTGTAPPVWDPSSATLKTTIGGASDAPLYFKGALDEVQFYTNGFSQAQVEALYLAGSAGVCVMKASTIVMQTQIEATYNDPTFHIGFVLRDSGGEPIPGRAVRLRTYTGPWPTTQNDYDVTTDENGAVSFDAPLNGSPANGTTGTQTTLYMVYFAGDRQYRPTQFNGYVHVSTARPTITWNAPAPITYGTPLSSLQLNATANTTGTFTYMPARDAIVWAGARTLSVTFVPSNTNNWFNATASVPLTVLKATPTVTITGGGPFIYDGQPHAVAAKAMGVRSDTLTPVTVTYNGAPDVPVNAGVYAVVASFAGNDNYVAREATSTLTIEKATPSVTATGGAFTYDATPHAATATATGIGGAPLGPIDMTYNGLADPPVAAGLYTVEARYAGSTNYAAATSSATVTIAKATPIVSVSGGTFTYDGAAHAATASATGVGGSSIAPIAITYDGGASAPVNAGVYAVVARFAGNENYNEASASTTLTIEKAATTVTWATPAGIVYGTPLGAGQLNATASVAGTFAYTPAEGAVLNAGAGQTLSVVFTPTDGANYRPSSATVVISVTKAVPVITWPAPSPIGYGAALSSAQLDATASVPGAFTYAPAAGSLLGAGAGHNLTAQFTPEDTANYASVGVATLLSVLPAPLTIRASDAAKPFGAPMPALSATAVGFVNGESVAALAGTLVFAAPQEAETPVGTYAITPGGVASANYAITFASGTLTVTQAATAVGVAGSASPSGVNQAVTWTATVSAIAPGAGAPAGVVEFRDGAARLGTVALVDGVATLSTNGLTAGSHAISAVYSGDPRFTTSTGTLTQTVNAANSSSTTAVTSSAGTANVGANITLTATVTAPAGGAAGTVEFFDGDIAIGSAALVSTKAKLIIATLAAGSHAITARFPGSASAPPSTSPAFVQVVAPSGAWLRTSSVSLTASPSPVTLDGLVTFTATVTGSLGTQPTGRVLFMVNGRVIDNPAGLPVTRVNSTTARVTLATSTLAKGKHNVTAIYLGDGSYKGQAGVMTLTVN